MKREGVLGHLLPLLIGRRCLRGRRAKQIKKVVPPQSDPRRCVVFFEDHYRLTFR